MRILFFLRAVKVLKEYLPLMRALRQKGFTPMAIVDWPCPEDWLTQLEQAGVAYLNLDGLKVTKATTGVEQKRAVAQQGRHLLPSWLWRELTQLRILLGTFRLYFRWRRILVTAFRRIRPDLIILPGEGNLFRLVPIQIAAEARIPSLLLPQFYVEPETEARYRLKQADFEGLYSMKPLLNRLSAWLRPRSVRYVDSVPVLRDPGGEALALWVLGLMPWDPWVIGTGLSSRVAVQNDYEYQRLLAAGVNKEKLAVTGKPSEDLVYQELQTDTNARRRQLGLQPGKPVILCALPHYAEHGMLAWPEHWREIDFLLDVFDQLDTETLLTLYPDSNEEDYRRRIANHRAILPNAHNVFSLMGVCDIYVANAASSTVVQAIGAHKPVVAFDLINAGGLPHINNTGVVLVKRHEDLLPCLQRLLTDRGEIGRLVSLQEQAAPYWIKLDGQCTARVMAQIADMLCLRTESIVSGGRKE